jgi:retinol dehydrogenase 12
MYPAPFGAITQLYAGTSPDLTTADSGKYFMPWARPGFPLEGMQDLDLAMKLWDFLDKETEGNC